MSKIQDTIHRFIVDITIVAGCVCLAVATRAFVNGANRFTDVTLSKVDGVIDHTDEFIIRARDEGFYDAAMKEKPEFRKNPGFFRRLLSAIAVFRGANIK